MRMSVPELFRFPLLTCPVCFTPLRGGQRQPPFMAGRSMRPHGRKLRTLPARKGAGVEIQGQRHARPGFSQPDPRRHCRPSARPAPLITTAPRSRRHARSSSSIPPPLPTRRPRIRHGLQGGHTPRRRAGQDRRQGRGPGRLKRRIGARPVYAIFFLSAASRCACSAATRA